VVEEIAPRCSCVLEIVDEAFRCIRPQETTVVFRARATIKGPASLVAADDIVNRINEWVQTSPSITVGLATLSIDSSYPAMLASSDSDNPEESTTEPPSMSSSPSFTDSPFIIIIVAAVLAVLAAVLVIVVIVLVCFRCKKAAGNFSCTFTLNNKHTHMVI